MRPPPDRDKQYRPPAPSWRISRTWGGSKDFIGLVTAADEVKAIEVAIRTFHITNPDHQKHLVAEARE
jgi:hypothetical protein